MKVAVIGAGAWGTALAQVMHANECELVLWSHTKDRLDEIRQSGMNSRLPGVKLPAGWGLEEDLQKAVAGVDCVVLAVPSRAFRETAEQLSGYKGTVVAVTKGIEFDTGLTMCGVLAEVMPHAACAALSGPNIALEVARGMPAASVVASKNAETLELVKKVFHCIRFRVYTSQDVIGVEMGGALKNVVALAAGIGDGLGYGDNSKAGIITRGIVEMRRLGVACGAHADTFSGLSGLGDLTVTCFSKLSRNRGFGERLGNGEELATVLDTIGSVAEGYPTVRSAHRLAAEKGVSAPIIEGVYSMLYEGKDLKTAVMELISRASKAEDAV